MWATSSATLRSVSWPSPVSTGTGDRAMATARGVVRDRPDWWVPLLFTRLRSGRLWYSPGFVRTADFEQWPALISAIEGGRCTPILGPGVTDVLVGTRHDIARRWAQTYRFPMANDRDDLAQVAQYVAVNYDDTFLRDELGKYLVNELAERYGEMLAMPANPARRHSTNCSRASGRSGARRACRIHSRCSPGCRSRCT